MTNTPDFFSPQDSYQNLLQRMTRKMREKNMVEEILQTMQRTFDNELAGENLVLSRPERVRLFKQAAKPILTEMLEKLDSMK